MMRVRYGNVTSSAALSRASTSINLNLNLKFQGCLMTWTQDHDVAAPGSRLQASGFMQQDRTLLRPSARYTRDVLSVRWYLVQYTVLVRVTSPDRDSSSCVWDLASAAWRSSALWFSSATGSQWLQWLVSDRVSSGPQAASLTPTPSCAKLWCRSLSESTETIKPTRWSHGVDANFKPQ